MKIDEAKLYLEHTSKDDFNLEEWQQNNRYKAIQVVLEEIERLKEEYMILQNASDEVEEEKDKEIERLNNIISKAIEYIEIYNEEENPDYGSAFINKNDYSYVLFDEYRESLLNILRGEDKE